MRYVIMADGKMTRWEKRDTLPKHLVKVNGETLLARLVRQLKEYDPDCEIIITSHNEKYEIPGALRYEPENNIYEIDRFTWELIEDDVCFLYGDTYYTDGCISEITDCETDSLYFFGNRTSVFAVLAGDADLMKECIKDVKCLYIDGRIKECRGWQLYQRFENLPYDKITVKGSFTLIEDGSMGINTAEEYEKLLEYTAE